MKSLLFHAIKPPRPTPAWDDFLFDASTLALPDGAQKLAENVWLLPPGDRFYRQVAQLGHQHGIETRCVAIVHGAGWQPLSPSR